MADERARIAEQASAMREQMTPEQMEAQMAAQDALANAEAGEVRKTVMGEGPTPTRYAPNGDSIDAVEFMSDLGEQSVRCSACELVTATMDEAIDGSSLVSGWAEWTSAERAKKLRPILVRRGCRKFDTMQVALTGFEGSRRFVDFDQATQDGSTLTNLQMGVAQADAVHTLCRILAKEDVAALVSQMEAWLEKKRGRRLIDIKMREQVCVELLGECEEKKAEGDDDDDDDGTNVVDDREL